MPAPPLAHLAELLDGDGKRWIALYTPELRPGYVEALGALPQAVRRWRPELRVWTVRVEVAAAALDVIGRCYGADVCEACAAGERCAIWPPLAALARAEGIGTFGPWRGVDGEDAPEDLDAGDAREPLVPAEVREAAVRLHVRVDAPPVVIRAAAAVLAFADPVAALAALAELAEVEPPARDAAAVRRAEAVLIARYMTRPDVEVSREP